MGQAIPSVDLLDGPNHVAFRATLPPAERRLLDTLAAEGGHGDARSPFAAALHAVAERLEQDQRLPRRGRAQAMDAADEGSVPA
jgi:hypothetical protein